MKRRRKGFTLMEAMMAAIVLAILVLGICSTFSGAYQEAQQARTAGTAAMLARQLADEITSKPLADPSTGSTTLGPGMGMTSRSQYTHVTNYNGYSDTSSSMPLLGGGTEDVTGSQTYTRTVNVVVGAKASVDTASPTTDFAIVTVTVTTPDGQSVSISKFVVNDPVTR